MNVLNSRRVGRSVARYSSSFAFFIVITTICPNCNAIFLNNSDTIVQPFTIDVEQDSEPAIELTLRISNEADDPVSIVSWQLELALIPLEGSQGELLFSQITAPQDSLFGGGPGPLTDLEEPSAQMSAFDADYDGFSGVQLDPHEVRNILTLAISIGPQSIGDFELVARAYDPSAPDLGSSWFPAGASEPQAFENMAVSTLPQSVLLGTFHLHSSNQPGDYNNDQIINELDYQQWRLAFGDVTESAFVGSDGNGNSMVDAADYAIWRDAVTESMTAMNSGEPVSEPLFIIQFQALLCLALSWVCKYRTRRASS